MERELLEKIRDALGIINTSEGVAGWHLNGDVEPWGRTAFPGLLDEINEPLADPPTHKMRYEKLRRWMSSNVIEGWQEVERLGAIAVYEGWDAFDLYLDELPECNVGLSKTGENQ